jgi:hypothetical protein
MAMYNSYPRVCAICGKIFYPAVMHQYKKKHRGKVYIACSYTCYNVLEKRILTEKRSGQQTT